MLPLVRILRPDGTIADMEKFLSLNLDAGFYKKLYRLMILTRLLDREGRLLGTTGRRPDKTDKNTLFIGPYGQEAAEIASAMALPTNAWTLAYTRSFGAAIGRGVSPKSILRFFAEAKMDEVVRDLLSHKVHRFYTAVGIHLSHAEGIAQGAKLQGETVPAAAYFGDGATSEGFFHEALNWASIYQVPVLFFCENNQWAISTPTCLNKATPTFAERALGYGMDFEYVDGNDPLAVTWATQRALKRAYEESRATLVEYVTYRLGPHTTAAGAVVEIPKEEMERAINEDPLPRLQRFLLSPTNPLGVNWKKELEDSQELFKKLSSDPAEAEMLYKDTHLELRREDAGLVAGLNAEIRQLSEEARLESLEVLARGKELVKKSEDYHAEPRVDDLYKNLATQKIKPRMSRNISAEDAIPLAVYDALSMDKRVIYLGQDVAEAGGVMRTTALRADLAAEEKFIRKVLPDWENRILHRRLPLKYLFPTRIFNTPLDESGLIGSGLGLALNFDMQLRPIIEIQFSGFGRVGYAQLDEWSRMLHRYVGLPEIKIPGVIIMPFGGGKRIEYHRENEIPPSMNNPGLIIVCPSIPQDFYDMFIAAIASDKPVMYFSHLELYRHPKIEELIRRPPSKPIEEFGIRIAREGEDITIAAYGKMVHECLAVAEDLATEKNISVEVLDLRVLSPLKRGVVVSSVAKTGRLVTVDEGPIQGNVGAEIAAIATEEKESLLSLNAPVRRVGSPRTLWPGSKSWTYYIPQKEDIKKAILDTVNFK